ncbi:unnamed protein product [Ixodes pacificus]
MWQSDENVGLKESCILRNAVDLFCQTPCVNQGGFLCVCRACLFAERGIPTVRFQSMTSCVRLVWPRNHRSARQLCGFSFSFVHSMASLQSNVIADKVCSVNSVHKEEFKLFLHLCLLVSVSFLVYRKSRKQPV